MTPAAEPGAPERRAPRRGPGRLPSLAADLRGGGDLASYLDLLEARFGDREPEVQAFVPEAGRFERLRREARALADQHPDPEARPPLYGVPVGVKDVFRVRGFPTGAGSRLPAEELHGPEAESVSALKAAGALVLGKTVSTEFAYFAPGPTRNPKNPAHTPGGSSSGSAAAVGAGLAPLALGTQTIGSISRPAAFCGVAGYKPSYDRISRSGVVPLAPSLDHVGVFAADAGGAELAASLLCRGWKAAAPARRPVLGVPEGPYLERASAEGREHFEGVCRRLERAGYALERVPVMADLEAIEARHGVILAAEAARVHARWFPRFGELYHARTAELVRRGRAIAPEELAAALAGLPGHRRALMAEMDARGLDLWISPPAPGAAPSGLESTGDPVMNLPWTQAGLPTLTLPAGRNAAGLPLGLQLAGRWWADEALLAWGRELEEALSVGEAP